MLYKNKVIRIEKVSVLITNFISCTPITFHFYEYTKAYDQIRLHVLHKSSVRPW